MGTEPARRPVIFLMGPTATGKSDLALALHEHLPVDIISVDSAMVYRGLDIGTAKPPRAVRAAVPHRLIDICEPTEAYSAGRFRDDALAEIRRSHGRGRVPLLVGGTGLYFRALEAGIAELPAADDELRGTLEKEAEQKGWKQMHAQLAEIDPTSAARIHPNDPQRIQRALEVYRLTGTPMSALLARGRAPGLEAPVHKLVVAPAERHTLHERIERRFLEMLEAELIEEVRGLYERPGVHSGLPAMRLVGYRQVGQYLAGELDYNRMISKAITATRQLARRQLTWLRSEQGAAWFEAESGQIREKILTFLRRDPIFYQ